jgi:hypothetical protein
MMFIVHLLGPVTRFLYSLSYNDRAGMGRRDAMP